MANLTAAADALNAIRAGSCVPITSNLGDAAGCHALADEMAKRVQQLDILVNNSGVAWASPMESVEERRGWDNVFNLNTKSVFYLTVALLPLLKKGKSVEQPAQVINISSIYGSLPHANMPTAKVGHGAWSYLSSKAATSHLTRVLAAKLKPEHINVNALAPGFFPTTMTRSGESDALDASHPGGRMGSQYDLAGPALLLATNAHLSGVTLPIDGGATLIPAARLPPGTRERHMPVERADRLNAKL
ncbi:NAD(P)-binding protein [Tilletiopsis washingtonensis]|uniref:NAD(P)-binding protein n=1 Tax=Tilletiopsis washingtonensis TaxID=58919 RepID=A0A316Z2C1_9BASI|nr:NAD(P)-binding protein [Tilletiopsis washingtonensis]PWN95516.1 NAD(P)-binding protein [Tilletiopsis washingtonensis]